MLDRSPRGVAFVGEDSLRFETSGVMHPAGADGP